MGAFVSAQPQSKWSEASLHRRACPVNSTRWELLRDGVEDYEYFWMLQQQVHAAQKRADLNAAQQAWLIRGRDLLIVPAEVSASLTQYTTDPLVLLNRRAQMAAAIAAGAHLLR
ncbi:MAG: DUF4091 domain-containing protein [Armatimonadetes bacterium]|nr:DUF4091 domain-containing protein [Armatimonadota bacterium]